jgi:signal transduction histidine kinase
MAGVTTTAQPRAVHDGRVPRSADRVLFGVAGGYAERWRVEPTVLRASIGLLALAGGVGVVLYAIGYACSSPRTADAPAVVAPSSRRRDLAVAAATAAMLLTAERLQAWPGDGLMIPATIVAIAVVLIWRPRDAEPTTAAGRLTPVVRVVLGTALAVAGIATLAGRTGNISDLARALAAIAIVLGGAAVIAAPAIGRLLGTVDAERSLRIREEERAALAAHLHDSVLQSLVLIQRADDPRRMAGLARRQERELRAWLYGSHPATQRLGEPTSLMAAVEAMTATIEVDHEVRIEAVTVGDAPIDDVARALLGALREATTNAAHHSGADHVDVYVEADPDELVAFVRDTGAGFDPTAIAPDRHGIADSIIGRIERVGGRATVTSSPGAGTEVELTIARRARDGL